MQWDENLRDRQGSQLNRGSATALTQGTRLERAYQLSADPGARIGLSAWGVAGALTCRIQFCAALMNHAVPCAGRANWAATCAGGRRLWLLSVTGCPSASVLSCRLTAWHGQDLVVPTNSTLSAADMYILPPKD
jgi:hypothetical protein